METKQCPGPDGGIGCPYDIQILKTLKGCARCICVIEGCENIRIDRFEYCADHNLTYNNVDDE